MNRPDDCLVDYHSLLQVLEKEYDDDDADALIARLYYDVFQISITHGDQARASHFAKREYKLRVICEEGDAENEELDGIFSGAQEFRGFYEVKDC